MTTGRIRPSDRPLLTAVAQAAIDESGLSGRSFADSPLLGDFLAHAVEAARRGRRLSAQALAGCTESGALAARLGIASRVAVDLYLSAAWLLWRDGPDLGPPGSERETALWLMRAADDGAAALTEGFQEARAAIVRMEASARQELVESLLTGGQVALSSLHRAESMGLSMTGPMIVLVAANRPRFPATVAPRLAPEVERALRGRFSDSLPLVTLHDDNLLVVAAAPDKVAVETVATGVATVLRSRLGAFAVDGANWRVAVSTPRVGPASVSSGYHEAREVLELAYRCDLPGPVADSAELVGQRVLLRDREASWDLVERTLSGLTQTRDGGRDLLATLLAYFDNGGNTTATATALHLSVRAVSYRLQRVAGLTGHNPADPRDWLTLHMAAATAALLGWPDERRP